MIKRILVPTDFSENAEPAALLAAYLADKLDARITFMHVSDVISPIGMYGEVNNFVQQKLRKQMGALLTTVFTKTNLKFDHEERVVGGDLPDAIREQAEEHDLVVMGAKGTSDLDRFFWGSTTLNMVQRLEKPVLVVPVAYEFEGFDSAVFATDAEGVEQPDTLMPFRSLIQAFDMPLKVFHLNRGEEDEELSVDLQQLFGNTPYSLHYEMGEQKVADSLLEFSVDEKAGLLCMVRHRRTFWESLFNPSTTDDLIFKVEVPLLVLHE